MTLPKLTTTCINFPFKSLAIPWPKVEIRTFNSKYSNLQRVYVREQMENNLNIVKRMQTRLAYSVAEQMVLAKT